jgi:hypothetical protein
VGGGGHTARIVTGIQHACAELQPEEAIQGKSFRRTVLFSIQNTKLRQTGDRVVVVVVFEDAVSPVAYVSSCASW